MASKSSVVKNSLKDEVNDNDKDDMDKIAIIGKRNPLEINQDDIFETESIRGKLSKNIGFVEEDYPNKHFSGSLNTEPKIAAYVTRKNDHRGGEVDIDVVQQLFSTPGNSWTILQPQNSKILHRWDLIIGAAMLFTCFVTPYEVAFVAKSGYGLFVMNTLVNTVFIIDIILQFRIMYRDENGQYEGDPWLISLNYLKTWFIIDVVSILPFDIIRREEERQLMEPGAEVSPEIQLMRVVRLLRLLKLFRLVRAARLLSRWDHLIGISYKFQLLLLFFFRIIILAHWMASALGIIATGLVADDTWSWVNKFKTDVYTRTCPNFPLHTTREECDMIEEIALTSGDVYSAALFWSVSTITTIGFGDISLVSTIERVMGTILMTIAGCVWIHMIGTLCGVFTALNVDSMQYRVDIDNLNSAMSSPHFSQELRIRLRDYLQQRLECSQEEQLNTVVHKMSPTLKEEVLIRVYTDWIKSCYYIKNLSSRCLVRLIKVAKTSFYSAKENFSRPFTMYYLLKGLCLHSGRVIKKGKIFGEKGLLLQSYNLDNFYMATTLSFVSAIVLGFIEFNEVLDDFPKERMTVRKHYVRAATRASILLHVRKMLGTEPENSDQDVQTYVNLALKDLRDERAMKSYHDAGLTGSQARGYGSVTKEDLEPLLKESVDTVIKKISTQLDVEKFKEQLEKGIEKKTSSIRKKMEELTNLNSYQPVSSNPVRRSLRQSSPKLESAVMDEGASSHSELS